MKSGENNQADEPLIEYSPREFKRTFRARVTGETAAERFDEMIELVELTIKTFEELLRPTRATYHIKEQDEEHNIKSEGSGEITRSKFARAVREACPSGDCHLISTTLSGPTLLRLAEGDHWIDIDSVRYVDPLREDEPPANSPITISVGQTDVFVEGYEHIVDVKIHVDAFTQDSPAGTVNRRRLGTALERVHGETDVFEVRLSSEVHSEEGFKQKGFDELLFAD